MQRASRLHRLQRVHVEHLSNVTVELLVESRLPLSRELLAREHLKWCTQCEELRLEREAHRRKRSRERDSWWRRMFSLALR